MLEKKLKSVCGQTASHHQLGLNLEAAPWWLVAALEEIKGKAENMNLLLEELFISLIFCTLSTTRPDDGLCNEEEWCSGDGNICQ